MIRNLVALSLALLGSVAVVRAITTGAVGSCTVPVEPDSNFNYDQFAKENGGLWNFLLVPDEKTYANLILMFMDLEPIASFGVYEATIYQQRHLEEPKVFAKTIHVDTKTSDTHYVTSKPIISNTTTEFRLTFLLYIPQRLAYYYVCSDDGTDDAMDHRFVVTNAKLTADEKAQIKKIEQDMQFKGRLRFIVNN